MRTVERRKQLFHLAYGGGLVVGERAGEVAGHSSLGSGPAGRGCSSFRRPARLVGTRRTSPLNLAWLPWVVWVRVRSLRVCTGAQRFGFFRSCLREIVCCFRARLLEQENEVLRRAAAYLAQANLPKE